MDLERPHALRRIAKMPMTEDLVQSVTADTFDSLVLACLQPVTVEFMSYGCGHCREMEHVLQEVAVQLGSAEPIFRVNTALDRELTNRYEIEGTPTFVMFFKGNEVGRAVGPDPSIKVLADAITRPFEGLA